ncbi:MAG: transcription elongation factor GreA [Candidatus Kapaibacterium sp.]
MSDVVYMTRERVKEIEDELRELKTKGRKEIAQKIADARSHGDLSENADYDAAKHEQELLEIKIGRLDQILSKVQIITADEFPDDKVYILSKVKLSMPELGEEMEYMLVSPEEADFEQNKLSVSSPLGKALMGRKIGDVFEVRMPAGTNKYEVLDIYK